MNLRRILPTIFNFVVRVIGLLVIGIIGFEIYDRLLMALFDFSGYSRLGPFLLLWAVSAYIALPLIHRRLTKIYLPDYYVGRVRTGDGLLGDPVNIGINGTKAEIMKAMKAEGWREADPLSFGTTWKMTVSSVLKRSYPTAPVSSLYLFGEKQQLTFQKEINNNPHARHHVRFWKTPNQWWLPGGHKVDWLGAATYDRRVGLSLFTGQITHKIAENTDTERDFVASSLSRHGKLTKLEHFSTAYRSRNGGGDAIETDGSFVIMNLR